MLYFKKYQIKHKQCGQTAQQNRPVTLEGDNSRTARLTLRGTHE